MKLVKNKKSLTGLLRFPTLAFIVALILFFLFTAPKIDEYIGGKQAAVIRVIGQGEQELSFVDVSARLAAWQSLFELGEQGGFYYDTGDDFERAAEEYPCDKFVYNLWNARSEKCWPDAKKAYKQYFDKNLKQNFFSQQQPKNKLNRITYEYEINTDNKTKHTFITGLTNDSVPIPIIYEKKIIEEKLFMSDVLPEKEHITKCCDDKCVVSVAEYYYNMYGPSGIINLPYVWGGVTPYPVKDTRKDQEKHGEDSFFHGAYIHYPSQPEPYDTKLTVPGFDCSGFVWWAYKHADIPNFDARLGAKEYEKLAEDEGYAQICGFSKPCTDEIIKKNAMPGDLLFKHNKPNGDATHIAIYTGDGYIIDSSSDSNGIDKRPIPDSWLEYLTVYGFPYNKPSDKDCVFGEIEITPSTGVIPEDAYNRIMRYDEIIKKAADKNKISEALIKAVIMQESRGDENAVSDTGCEGIMQFCDAAAKQYDLEDPFDPEGSIKKGAEYFRDLLKQFEKYAHKDAFAIASYNVGSGVVEKAIKNIKKITGNDDPSWREVSYGITPQLIYDIYCKGGEIRSGHFCMQGDYCINDRCASKVKEVRTYVDNVLNYIAAFGGGSFSTPSTYTRIFTPKEIGSYYVNPSFTTEVDYDLGVYEGINAWAEATYKNCSGTEEDLYLCVKNKTSEWNKNYEDMMNKTSGNINSPFLFKFDEQYVACDDDDTDYYDFIETFELCLEFGNPACYCDFEDLDFGEIRISNKSIVLYDKDGVKEYYDFTNKKKFNLYHNGELKDYFIITKAGVEYWVEYFKDGKSDNESSRPNLYFIKNGLKMDDLTFKHDELTSCNLIGKQHKFRFCVTTPQKSYSYEENELYLKEVPIRFALDLYDAPPPAITSDGKEINKPEEMIEEEEANELTEDKKCEDLGKAEFNLHVTTADLKPAYEGFITNIVTTILPQLKVLLFAQNFLAFQDSLPAPVTVQLDLKGASEDCDITGLVYKCGLGKEPRVNGKVDFSNPTGYIDISSRFNTPSEFSAMPPDACMLFNNPDGSLMDKPIRHMKPQIDGDIISFSIDKCIDPITQFKKMEGIDIISSALQDQGFDYYFAFAYVDAAGNYGRATVRNVSVPSVINKLLKQLGMEPLGITEWFEIIDNVNSIDNPDSLFEEFGLADEFRAVKRALKSNILNRYITNLPQTARNAVYNEMDKYINDQNAPDIIKRLVKEGLNDDDAKELLKDYIEKFTPEKADGIIEKLDSRNLRDVCNHATELPLEKKKELLEKVYDKKEEVKDMSEGEVNSRLKRACRKKQDAIEIIKSFDPKDKIDSVKDYIQRRPGEVVEKIVNTMSDSEQAQALKGADASAQKILNYAPSDVHQAVYKYIKNIRGFQEVMNFADIFINFGGPLC